MNDYEKALFDVGNAIDVERYNDETQSFQVFGFGGIPKHMNIRTVNHCFALNG